MLRLLIVSLVWAFSFGLIKRYLAGIDSSVVSGLRLAMSLAVFLPFFRPRAVNAPAAISLIIVGAIQFGLTYMAYIASFKTLSAYEIAVLTIFTPFWVCLFNDILERRFTGRAYIAAAIAVIGTGVIVVTRRFDSASAAGVIMVQASNACFAAGQVIYRRWKLSAGTAVRDHEVFGWLYLGGVLVTLPSALPVAGEVVPSLTGTQWLVLAYLGILASGICFFLWNVGAAKVSAGTLAVMNNLKIPLAVACSLLLFGENADAARLLGGGALIALALWIARERKPAT